MWAAKFFIAMLAIGVVVWLVRKAWFMTHPSKELDRLESALMYNVRQVQPGNALLNNWAKLCALIKHSVEAQQPAITYRGTEVIKLFVGEYFRRDINSSRLNAVIYKDLANLYAAMFSAHQERAMDIIVALRVAARETAGKNEAAFNDIVRQFVLYGILALREGKTYSTSQIIDQLFLLLPKCAGVTTQRDTLLGAIAAIGEGAVKRRDSGIIRETVVRLLRLQETLGSKVLQPIHAIILKGVRYDALEIVDIALEASYNGLLLLENVDEAQKTLRIWSEAAQSALLKHDDKYVYRIILLLTQVVEARLPVATHVKMTLEEVFSVIFQALRKRPVVEHGIIMLPLLELGSYCMQRELRSPVVIAAYETHRFTVKYILDKLLYAGTMITRGGQISTGAWVTGIYQYWLGLPDKVYDKENIRKFIYLWLLYWSSGRRRSAHKQGGIPDALFEQPALSAKELAKFPDLDIRQTSN